MRVLLLVLALSGCGYRLVRPGAVAASIGVIDDLGTEGDLGLRAAARLRRYASASADRRLTGRVQVEDEGPVGFDGSALSAAFRAEVVIALQLSTGDQPLWRDRVRREARWIRGPTPLETDAARRHALAVAVDAAIDAAWARLCVARIEGDA